MLFRENDQIAVLCAAELDGNFEFVRVSSNVSKILEMRSM